MSAAARHSLASPLRGYVAAVAVAGWSVRVLRLRGWSRRICRLSGRDFCGADVISGRITLKVPSLDASFTSLKSSRSHRFSCSARRQARSRWHWTSLLLAWQRRFTVQQAVFNFGNLALAVWLSGRFSSWCGAQPLFDTAGRRRPSILPLGLSRRSYFVVNTGLIAIAIGLQNGDQPACSSGAQHFMRLVPGYAAGASFALLLVAALRRCNSPPSR